MTIKTRKDNGRKYAVLKTGNPSKPRIRITLGTTNAAEAKQKAKEANLVEIEAALKLGALSNEAVSRLTHGRKLTLQDAVGRYLAARRVRAKSTATIAKDESVLTRWFTWRRDLAKRNPLTLAAEDFDSFINAPGLAGKNARERMLSCLRGFVGFMADNGMISSDPSADVRVNVRILDHGQRETKDVQPFTATEVKKMLANFDGWWRWAVGISYATGLRIGDICQLEHASFAVPGHIIVHTDKGKRRVCLPIDNAITPGLASILAEIPPTNSPYVFPDQQKQYADIKSGRPRFSVYFQRELTALGIEGKSFHSLRHTALTRWAAQGFSLDQCRAYAGHGSSASTKGYIHA